MQKKLFWIFILCFSQNLFAQKIGLSPLTFVGKEQTKFSTNARTESDTIVLKLPFYDDFSKKMGIPDTALWERNGGVFVNNTMGVNPPSQNVATFDGVDYKGEPYNFVAPTSSGFADYLVSHRIDMSKMIYDSAVFFSFYWQAQGLGDQPESEDGDYLELQFKNNLGEWVTQWKQTGKTLEPFKYEHLQLVDQKYFHKDFQFRFRAHNRLSGAYDVWNIDYVYLNRLRKFNDFSLIDVAAVKQPSSYIKNYWAMPMKHFLPRQKTLKTDTIRSTMYNLDNNFNAIAYQVVLKDLVRGDRLGRLIDTAQIIDFKETRQIVALPLDSLPKDRKRMILEYEFRLNTGEGNPLPSVNLRQNDTIRGRTVLDNYYAYDDGSAEYGIWINQKYGKFAYEYNSLEPDVITHLDVNFLPLGANLKGETVNLYVWKNIGFGNSSKDTMLLVQNTYITYPDSINRLVRIQLSRPIRVQGKFFIGFEQLNENNVVIGFDRNTDSSLKMFYNVTNVWEQNTNKNLKGSVLMRPVFGESVVTSNKEANLEESINLYPNPTNGILRLEGKIQSVELIDLYGKILESKNFRSFETKEIQFAEGLPNGLYLVRAKLENGNFAVKKVVLSR